jgi:hypothetical protein
MHRDDARHIVREWLSRPVNAAAAELERAA